MKKKSIFILLAVLVVLVVVVIIIEGPLSERSKKEAAKESILFPGFETDQVSSVDIKTQDKEVKLKKEDNTWVVATAGNYPADPKSIEDMLGKVRDLKSTLTASKSADKHSQFEVDESGVEVTMLGTGEKALAHFFVGKMGPDYISTYVRKADQDEVLLVGEYLRGVFDKGARGWRDRTVFDFDASQVQTLTLVSKLEADDFAEQKEETTDPLKEYKLDKPQSKVVVDLTDGTARVLLIGDESGYRRYAKREDKDIVFLVSKSKIYRIFKDIEELKAEVEEGKESEPEETP
jgi:flagellar basal body-associated protein FliL